MSTSETFNTVPPGRAVLIRWLLLATIACLIVGLITPMMTMTKLLIFENSFSVISGVYELLLNGQYPLFAIVTLFSIVLPFCKIYVIYRLVGKRSAELKTLQRYIKLMHEYGRWAMLDVMVVAVLIVTVKLGALASIEVHYGLYVFGLSVMSLMLITHWVVKLTDPIPSGSNVRQDD